MEEIVGFKPLHILVVTQYFWPENFRINDLVSGLMERRHKVTVLTGIPNYPEGAFFDGYSAFNRGTEHYDGASVVRVPLIPRGSGSGIRLALNYLSFVVSASLLAPWRCREKYDVIFIFEPSPVTVALPAILLRKLRKIPVMFWVQDLWPESLAATGAVTAKWVLRLVGKLVSYIYRRCDRILVTSRAYLDSITRYVDDHGQILYFPQYGEQLYQPMETHENSFERSLIPGGFIIMFAGNIGSAQDFGTILSAANILKEFKDIHFIVLGDGRARKWVEEEAARLNLEETFHLLGRYPLDSMPAFFALADAMLVTLKSDPVFSLTIPAKIQSYFACGKPVIAALDGEGARIVNEAAAGITCPTESPEALAASILELRSMDNERLREMGNNALRYYRANFDREMLIGRLENWMKSVVDEKNSLK